MTTTEKEIAVAFSGISYNNLQSKMEKIALEFNKLINDITLVNAGTAVSTTSISRYPSSQNRYTNTTGGL
jgi:aspartate ammonia-lyase